MSELLGALGGTAIGVAVGEATATVLEPSLEGPKQEALKDAVNAKVTKVLDLHALAALVAQALNSVEDVLDDAARNGYDEDTLRSAIQLGLKAPGVAESLTLYRRAAFDGVPALARERLLEHALAKAMIEGQYWDALKGLVSLPLESAQLAQGIHRGYIAYSAPGFIAPPDTPGKVPFYPQTTIDALATAAANGEDPQQLQVLVGIAGLPLSLFEMLQLLNRGLVTDDDVKRAIANSNLQNQYMDVALDLRRQLLTSNDYAELRLRGWITDQDGRDGAALHGMEPSDADLLYHMHGRPLIPHQIQTAIERGGVYDDPMKEDTPGTIRAAIVAQLQAEGYSLTNAHAFIDAAQESNLQPQYYGMYLANRFTLPSYFVVKAMLAAGSPSDAELSGIFTDPKWVALAKGGFTADDAAQTFANEGWPLDIAAKAAAALSPAKATTASVHVKSAQTAVVTAAKKAFLAPGLTPADASTQLQAAGLSAADAAAIIAQWTIIAQIEGVNTDTAGGTPH